MKVNYQKLRVRAHVGVILLGTFLISAGTNFVLFKIGISSIFARNPIVMVSGYLGFFFLTRLWLSRMEKNSLTLREVAAQSSLANLEEKKKKPRPGNLWLDYLGDLPAELAPLVVIVLVLVLIYVFLSTLTWVGAEVPGIFLDLAFDAALSAGLVTAAQKKGIENWYESLLRRTIVPFLILLSISTLFMLGAEVSCPGRAHLSEVVKQCWKH